MKTPPSLDKSLAERPADGPTSTTGRQNLTKQKTSHIEKTRSTRLETHSTTYQRIRRHDDSLYIIQLFIYLFILYILLVFFTASLKKPDTFPSKTVTPLGTKRDGMTRRKPRNLPFAVVDVVVDVVVTTTEFGESTPII